MLLNISDHIARNQLLSGRCDFGEGQTPFCTPADNVQKHFSNALGRALTTIVHLNLFTSDR